MSRITSLAGARGHFIGEQRVRLLRIYLGATTFLFTYGVVFTLFPVRTDLAYGNPVGGIIAIVLGVLGLVQLSVRPNRAMFATAVAVIATPVVMAFHVTLTAEYVCLIAPMFLAMYIRAFHPPRQACMLIGILILACVAAVAIAPAPHVGVITLLIIVVAIAGAAESFGLLMRAMFTAACTDPLTGLLNRAGWEIATTDLLAALRAPSAITVVALDIDDLKGLNDTQGHPAGDRLIIEYARHWARAAPRGAVLARLGGDEFAACIAGDDVEGFLDDVRSSTPRVSIGTATRTSGPVDIADLYARADAELYRGRDRARRDGSDVG
ncbi:GGDEF domain-containing protein [Mycolicibacterium frederiksbergense]|uniref:GGDEF domain-containing protein n=1 Tax=Mycolicibacterium frederiksbergense TaxID=117567 RepID=UPI00265BDD3F|nr:GGDEF domain-containing protein [Mycolicibacterium frederiksbergense]MBX9921957.1 GGDEF domain-containing protein [Mycolicibacterium frederiksbergense]MDO0974862.1 GGDEF domain-containing protein [Mycolicibacterium frederiksbergense]